MEEVVWSSGEKCQKSYKAQKPLLDADNKIINNIPQRSQYTTRKDNRVNERRQVEIMDRAMLIQTCQNPFLSKDFNDVLSDQEKYLIPRNSLSE